MRTAFALVAILATAPAWAQPGRCLIEVDGEPYLLGKCNVDWFPGGRGVSIGGGPPSVRSPYFASVSVPADGPPLASWNASPEAAHDQTDLGEVKRQGACWQNDRAKLCAWPAAAQPRTLMSSGVKGQK